MEHAPTNISKAVGNVPINDVFCLHCPCFDWANAASHCNTTSHNILLFGNQLPFFCEHPTYYAPSKGCKVLCEITHFTQQIFTTKKQSHKRFPWES